VDIFTELQQFGLEVHGYDPHADKHQVKEEYGINLLDSIDQSYDAIVLAVSHKEFLQLNFSEFSKPSAVLFDIKSFLDRGMVDARL